jgi:hypothetical protein
MLEQANSEYRMKIKELERQLEGYKSAEKNGVLGDLNAKRLPRGMRIFSKGENLNLSRIEDDKSFFVDINAGEDKENV